VNSSHFEAGTAYFDNTRTHSPQARSKYSTSVEDKITFWAQM